MLYLEPNFRIELVKEVIYKITINIPALIFLSVYLSYFSRYILCY